MRVAGSTLVARGMQPCHGVPLLFPRDPAGSADEPSAASLETPRASGTPAPARRRSWWRFGVVALLLGTVVTVTAVRWVRFTDERLRAELEAYLSDRLASDVRLDRLEITLLPWVQVRGEGLTLRIRNRPDLPPFVTVGRWSGAAYLSGLRIRHFDEIRLEEVTLSIPPRRLDDIRGQRSGGEGGARRRPPQMRIDRLVADHVVLQVMPRDADREPHVWDIRDLRMDPFSFDLASPFSATVDTPLASDRASVSGTAGPWPQGRFDQLPLAGEYVLDGRLDDVPGLRGPLTVRGRALGTLDRLATTGTAHSDAAGFTTEAWGTLPLDVDFEALFDATDSDVQLTSVEARAGRASIRATGNVTRTRGVASRRLSLKVSSPPTSSAADVLRLLIDAERPPVRGGLAVQAAVEIEPGERDVLDRLTVDGSFELRNATFLNPGVQAMLDEMSNRGQGWPDPQVSSVRAQLKGQMRLSGRDLRLAQVTLGLPGADISGGGRYSLAAQTIDFRGVARLDARLSQTQRGVKRLLLKPFDRLLAKGGAGTRVVVDVRGTRAKPVVDLDLGASLRGKR